MNRVHYNFPESEYFKEETEKKAICLHHTVSGPSIAGDITTWKRPGRIATHYIIERDGTVVQLFDDKYWAHHLGIKSAVFKKFGLPSRNTTLNKQTIGIELDSWGPLFKQPDGSFHHAYKRTIHEGAEVQEYPNKVRGYQFYEKYTKNQLKGLLELLIELTHKHKISNSYIPEMWDVSKEALEGAAGIWSHTSYRSDKSDVHPQPELINQLHTLILSGIT